MPSPGHSSPHGNVSARPSPSSPSSGWKPSYTPTYKNAAKLSPTFSRNPSGQPCESSSSSPPGPCSSPWPPSSTAPWCSHKWTARASSKRPTSTTASSPSSTPAWAPAIWFSAWSHWSSRSTTSNDWPISIGAGPPVAEWPPVKRWKRAQSINQPTVAWDMWNNWTWPIWPTTWRHRSPAIYEAVARGVIRRFLSIPRKSRYRWGEWQPREIIAEAHRSKRKSISGQDVSIFITYPSLILFILIN